MYALYTLAPRIRGRLRQWWRQLPVSGKLAVGLLAVCALVVGAQVTYPPGRALPLTRVQSHRVGAVTVAQATAQFERQYRQASLIITTDKKHMDWPLEHVGIDVLPAATARHLTDYPLYKRLIPFSSVGIMLHRNVPMQVRYDQERLAYYAKRIQKEGFVPSANAGITVRDGAVRLIPAKSSQNYPAGVTLSAIHSAIKQPSASAYVRLYPQMRKAKRPTSEAERVLKQAQHIVDTPLTVKVEGTETKIGKATIASWLTFPEDPHTKQLSVAIQKEAVAAHVNTMQPKTYRPPGETVVTLVDGKETSRTPGTPGRGIDVTLAAQTITQTLEDHKRTALALPMKQYDPVVTYKRQYTSQGLAVLLADIAAAKGDYAINVAELDGAGRTGNVNGDKPFVMASTYKLFVAYAVLKQVESGALHWNDQVNGDQAVDACFEAMIVRSDNPCGEALGRRIGWQTIERMVRAQGLTHTTFGTSFTTTANDLSLFLQKLYNGTLIGSAARDQLLSAMQRQIYRSGIPSGTHVAVADKVGFLDAYLHDAAIVYGPKGPYVMVVLSNGSSWTQLADTAHQVHNYLNRY